ncbi:unnamed protein product, partial [Symbiodinium necroappetens]
YWGWQLSLHLNREAQWQTGVKVASGEAPEAKIRTGRGAFVFLVSRQRLEERVNLGKVLKYSLGEEEDFMEALPLPLQDDESEILKHCWWRVLKGKVGEKSAIMQITMPEELIGELRQPMEDLLQSFRLGG